MSSYNLTRGEDLFLKEINTLSSENPNLSEKLKNLCSYFSGKVGVMQEGELNSIFFVDEKELLFNLNATPSFKKLAHSCLYALKNSDSIDDKELLEFVITSYNTKPIFNQENRSLKTKDISEDKIKENQEIESNLQTLQNYSSFQVTYSEESGEQKVKDFLIDNIDLIDDFDDEDLSLEGMRNKGIIDTNFDTLSNIEAEKKKLNSIQVGTLKVMEDGSFEIICPYTGSSNVYQIDSSTYASFDTDQPFKISFNLADLRPDN